MFIRMCAYCTHSTNLFQQKNSLIISSIVHTYIPYFLLKLFNKKTINNFVQLLSHENNIVEKYKNVWALLFPKTSMA